MQYIRPRRDEPNPRDKLNRCSRPHAPRQRRATRLPHPYCFGCGSADRRPSSHLIRNAKLTRFPPPMPPPPLLPPPSPCASQAGAALNCSLVLDPSV
mmetsp:Transcript_25697/g.56307  ORF Transcript_25697/g.56307 Transcript_25697/m.56307 type:complete len:97 (-) Transcript_25697:855-1145(-)